MPRTFGDTVIHQSHLDAISLVFPPQDVSLSLTTAQVNKNMPLGDTVIHQSHFDTISLVFPPLDVSLSL